MTKPTIESASERLFLHVEKVPSAPYCWRWLGRSVGRGYGQIKWFGRMALTHRITFELANGPIPAGQLVLHRCDNPRCVNPAHLFLGTHKDNAQDRDAKGRANIRRGTTHGLSKLTEAQVSEIRESPETLRVLAARYDVSVSLVSQVRTGAIWRHVSTPRRFPLPSGDRHCRTKLTDSMVLEIRDTDKSVPNTVLATKFNVSNSLICMVRKNKHRKHIPNAQT